MSQLTLGQKIASRRKLLNLSQEALSEQMDVSRQSVSKWESDAAIPDIDKLIALARIFGVSVGWLLGTEPQQPFDPQEGLTDAQKKMVEEIASHYQQPVPKKSPWKALLLCLCLVAAAAAFFLHFQGQLSLLSAENAAARSQIAGLTESNQLFQAQLNEMRALLETQSQTSKLLQDFGAISYVSADYTTANVHFLFVPKVYQENCTAYLRILNPAAGIDEMLECPWNYDHYVLRTDLPLADDYQYSFLLVSDLGYQEELISGNGHYFTDLYTHARFYMEETDPKYSQMAAGETTPLSGAETEYRYNVPLYTPILLEKNGLMPFRTAVITLRCNETVIWEQDYTEAFRATLKYSTYSEKPVMPDICVPLPPLAEGDRLTLALTATTFTDQTLITALDDLTVSPMSVQ